MINLNAYRHYWQSVADRLGMEAGVLPVTIDKEMGRRIQALEADSLTIFVFPPIAESTARVVDSYREENRCVIFALKKYNPQRQSAFEVLELTQSVIERIKSILLDDHRGPCPVFSLDLSSIETAPETELYGTFAGWSIGFNITTY